MAAVRGLDPWAIQRSDDGAVGISAADARSSVNALWAQSGPNRTYSGVVPQGTDPATKTPAGLIVTVTNPASMQLSVSAGQFVVQSDTANSAYVGSFTGTNTVTVPPSDASNDRIDLVYVYVEDSDAGLGSGKGSFLDVLQGTAGSGSAPTDQLPDAAVILSTVNVPAGSTVVTAVTDSRAFEVAAGGMRPIFNGIGVDEPGYPGQPRSVDFGDGSFSVDFYSGFAGAWLPIASKRKTWTPTVTSDNGPVSLGSGGSITGFYQQFVGGLTYVYCSVSFGSSGADAGYGDITVSFPPTATATQNSYETYIPCRLFTNTYGPMPGLAYVSGVRGNIKLAVPANATSNALGFLRSAQGGYNAGTGVPHVDGDFTLGAGDSFQFSGIYLAQQ